MEQEIQNTKSNPEHRSKTGSITFQTSIYTTKIQREKLHGIGNKINIQTNGTRRETEQTTLAHLAI